MGIFTFITILMMEYAYLSVLFSNFFGAAAFLLTAAICAASLVGVRIYCRTRKPKDTKAAMRTGTALVFGAVLTAAMIFNIVYNWRWAI